MKLPQQMGQEFLRSASMGCRDAQLDQLSLASSTSLCGFDTRPGTKGKVFVLINQNIIISAKFGSILNRIHYSSRSI